MDETRVQQLEAEVKMLREENRLLRQKIDLLVRRVFGKKSEALDADQLELLLGDDPPGQPEASGDAPAPEVEPKRRPSRRGRRKPRVPEDLPVDEQVLDPDEVLADPDAWRQIGEEVSEQLDYEPGRFLKRRLVRRTWVRRDDADHPPVTASLPPKLLERGWLAPGLLAHIVVSKYADHLPLYRQQEIYAHRHEVLLPRQTLAGGVELVADWLRPIADQLLREQLASGYVQIDETPVRVQRPGTGKAGQGYLWVVHGPGETTTLHWATGRGHQHLLDLLPEDFAGVVQCDGYGAYRTMQAKRPGVRLVGCWAHVRRKFFEAFEQGDAKMRSGWVLRQIGHLYAIEERLRESRAGPALRAAVRAHESRPILRRLHHMLQHWSKKAAHPPQSLMGKALGYALNQWGGLKGFVEDGRVEIDNNLVENAIRPAALGRKNWLFIGRDEAGWRSAVIYTLIQSCKNVGVEPYAYLKDVLERLPSMTNHEIPEVTPHAWERARSSCRKAS